MFFIHCEKVPRRKINSLLGRKNAAMCSDMPQAAIMRALNCKVAAQWNGFFTKYLVVDLKNFLLHCVFVQSSSAAVKFSIYLEDFAVKMSTSLKGILSLFLSVHISMIWKSEGVKDSIIGIKTIHVLRIKKLKEGSSLIHFERGEMSEGIASGSCIIKVKLINLLHI